MRSYRPPRPGSRDNYHADVRRCAGCCSWCRCCSRSRRSTSCCCSWRPGDAADIIAGQSGHATPEFVAAAAQRVRARPAAARAVPALPRASSPTLDLGYSFVQQHAGARPDPRPAAGDLAADGDGDRARDRPRAWRSAWWRRARQRRLWIDNVISVGALRGLCHAGLLARPHADRALLDPARTCCPRAACCTIGARPRRRSALRRSTSRATWCCRRLTLALFYVAIYTRLMRASMLEVYWPRLHHHRARQGRCRSARSPGATRRATRCCRSSRSRGLQFGHLLGGSVLVETVFGWPGLGRLVFDALHAARPEPAARHPLRLLGRGGARQPRSSTCSTACSTRGSCTNEARCALSGGATATTARRWAALVVLVRRGAARARRARGLSGRSLRHGRPARVAAVRRVPVRHRRLRARHPRRHHPRRAGVAADRRRWRASPPASSAWRSARSPATTAGCIDDVLMRTTEFFLTIPSFVLAVVLVAIFSPTVVSITMAIAVVSWPSVARLVRGEFIAQREREYVQAAARSACPTGRSSWCRSCPTRCRR